MENKSGLIRKIQLVGIGICELNFISDDYYFSKKFRELINIELTKDFTWLNLRNMVYKDDLMIFDDFLQTNSNNNMPNDIEFRISINNEIRWFKLNGECTSQHNTLVSFIGYITDETENNRKIIALNETIHRKNIALEAGHIGTWHVDINSEKQLRWRWDKLYNDMFYLDHNDSGNIKEWEKRLHPEDLDNSFKKINLTFESGRSFVQKYRATMPGGQVRYFMAKGKASRNHLGGVCRIDGICIDNTTIIEAELKLKQLNSELETRVKERTGELEESKERAEQASKSKSDFLSMMSHELRTPMNGVIGSLDLLATLPQNDESTDLIDTAKTSAENLVLILNDILDINKIEAGKLEIEDRAFSIGEVIDNVVKIFNPVADKSNIIFNVFEDPNIPMFVSGDSQRLRQVLFNIIGNALKFTHSTKEKTGIVTLTARVKESNKYVSTITILLEDNGIGMDAETQKKLFTPFSQAKRSTTRKYGGTGLGLAICAQLTEMMGGMILLESEEGKGSCFCVEIPFWLSRETAALDVESLSSINIAFIDLIEMAEKRFSAFSQYLVAEGAEVTKVASDLSYDYAKDFEIIVIFIDNFSNQLELIQSLIEQFSNTNNVIFAINDNNLDLSRKIYPDIKAIKIQSITRIQLIEAIKTFKDKNATLTLADWDLDELELEKEETEEKIVSYKEGILLVEDNPLNQKLIKKQLNNLGYQCDIACDGSEGIKQWEKNTYKLILSDCHMPVMDGYEMTVSIRELERSQKRVAIPIVAVTGAAMSGDSDLCIKAGMNDFVSKPVTIAALKKILKKWYPHE
ncbi:MAG: signal transduction histidine kinase/ActR/RegA family two-component response regulator [Alteromonadaceae bacterium]|jgi:signal transduction histidine kinase/ActR/RegA family two-component response regulator